MSNSQVTTKTAWIGLDVDSKRVVAAVDKPLEAGRRVAPRELPTNSFERSKEGIKQLLAWATAVAGTDVALRIVMESTGFYSADVNQWLCEVAPETEPAVVNPKFMKDFLSSLDPRTKNDRVDSQGIARFGTDRSPRATPPLSEAENRLRELMRLREFLVQERDALSNRLASTRSKETRVLAEKTVKDLDRRIEQTLKKALAVARKDAQKAADLSRLMEIFGVGEIIALTVLAEVGDLRRFKTTGQLANYCGLTPKTSESGEGARRQRMSKIGNSSVRRVLFMAASVNVAHNKTDMADWYRAAVARGMQPIKAMVRLMRKILDRMHLMITTSVPYERHPSKGKPQAVEML
jgi:transposase